MKRSFLERLYLWAHRSVYSNRLKKQIQFHDSRIICTGNLSAGGTGKTPLTLFVAEQILKRKKSVCVVLRGYGGKKSKSGGLVSDGNKTFMDADDSGDEAALFALRPGIRVVIGQNRVNAIKNYAVESDFILLDDAFQNPSVGRDFSIVCMDASVDPNQFRILPVGKFREDSNALKRADAIVLTRVAVAKQNFYQFWKELALDSGVSVFEAEEKISKPQPVDSSNSSKPEEFTAFCGIGNPNQFFDSLQHSGIRLKNRIAFRDHYRLKGLDFEKLEAISGPYITTEKDWVRIQKHPAVEKIKNDLYLSRLEMTVNNRELFLRQILNESR